MQSLPGRPSHPAHGRAPAPRIRIDRRTLLLGATVAGVTAACGGGGGSPDSSNGDGASGGSTGPIEATGDGADIGADVVVPRFPSDVLVPGEIRLPFSLAQAAEFVVDGPDHLDARVVDLDGNAIGNPISAIRRNTTPSPYYAFRTTIETPGFYGLSIDGGPPDAANFEVLEPSRVTIPRPGDPLPPFDTPTLDDPGGVDPVCTREPPCPFHTTTLTEALARATPVVYMVGTPAFCQTGTCAPALETLIAAATDFADGFTFVHAEVWNDLTATVPSPAMDAIGMRFEPALFITDAAGVVVERLDGLWDPTELDERLTAARG